MSRPRAQHLVLTRSHFRVRRNTVIWSICNIEGAEDNGRIGVGMGKETCGLDVDIDEGRL